MSRPLTRLRNLIELAKEQGLRVTGFEVDGERIQVFTAGADVPGAANDTDELKSLKERITGRVAGRS